jgi:hypothetical protein
VNVATVTALHNLKAAAAATAAAAAAAAAETESSQRTQPWKVKRARLLKMVEVVVGLIGGILEGEMWSKISPMSRQWTWH